LPILFLGMKLKSWFFVVFLDNFQNYLLINSNTRKFLLVRLVLLCWGVPMREVCLQITYKTTTYALLVST